MTDRRAHGAPRSLPDFGSTPVNRQGGFTSPAIPNPPTQSDGSSGVIPPAPPTVEVFPWWDLQWEAATAWSMKSLLFTVAAGGTTAVPNFSYQIPSQNRGIIKSIRMSVQNPVATINLSLNLLINTGPVQGWTGISFDPLAASAFVLVWNDVNQRMQQNDTLTASFTEASTPASAWTCSLQISGWQVPQAEIDRVQRGFKY